MRNTPMGACFPCLASRGGVRGTPYTIPFHLPPPFISIPTLRLRCLKLPFRLRSLYFNSEASPSIPKLSLRLRTFYLIPKLLLRVPTLSHIPELRSSIGLQSRNPFAFLNFGLGLSLISLCLSFSTYTSTPISVSTSVPVSTSIPTSTSISTSYPDFDFGPAGILIYVRFPYSFYSFLVVPFLL